MLADLSRTIEEFTYAGRFSVGTLVGAGIILLIVLGLLMWWEARAARRWVAVPLFGLRAAAVVIVLWMLAGPAKQTTVEHTRSKSLGLLVDTSGSMTTVDPPGEDEGAIRWAAAHESAGAAGAVAEADRAAVALSAARAHFRHFAEVCRGKGPSRQGPPAIASARKAAEAASSQLGRALGHLGDEPGPAGKELKDANSTLDGAVLPKLASLARDMESDRLLLAADHEARLEEVTAALDMLAERTRRAADALADACAGHPDDALRARLQAQSTSSRIEKVGDLLQTAQESWLGDLAKRARVIPYQFHAAVFPVGSGNWSDTLTKAIPETPIATDLTAALDQVLRDAAVEPLEAVVLLTDGAHNAESDPLEKASAAANLPVYVVPIGNTRQVRDVVLHHVQAPRAVFQNDLIVIEATIDAHRCAGEDLQVELVQDGDVIDRQEIAVATDTFVRRITFTRKAERMGMQEFVVRVAEVPDEKTQENNQAKVAVEVTEGKIRVLLADHLPHWEYRYLRNLFKRDEQVEYDAVLFEPAAAEGERTKPEFPKDLDGWARYRVVILHDVQPTHLTPQQQDLLVDYVAKRGGSLVLIAGKDAMPAAYIGQKLEQMLPVQSTDQPAPDHTQGYTVLLTPEGRTVPMTQLADDPLASEQFWREQFSPRSPIYDLSPYSRPKPSANVLIRAVPAGGEASPPDVERALLCWHNYGKGRVVYLAAPVTYKLRARYGDRPHHLFWGQLLRWAIAREVAGGSKTVRLATDKTRYAHGDQVRATVRLDRLNGEPVGGASARAVARINDRIVATEDLEEDQDQPGTYRAFLKDLPEGSITVEAAGAGVEELLASENYTDPVETVIAVEPPEFLEMRNTRCNLPLLERIAESTGGMVVPPTALETAVAQLDLSPIVTREVSQVPLWARWSLLVIVLGCLSVEWVVRKLAGMA